MGMDKARDDLVKKKDEKAVNDVLKTEEIFVNVDDKKVKDDKKNVKDASEPVETTNKTSNIMYLTIHSAENLPKMDVSEIGDPYVVIKQGKKKFKSDVIKNTSNPRWEFLTKIDLKKGSNVTVEVFDKDKFTKDDSYGQFRVDLKSSEDGKKVQHNLAKGG